MHEQGKDSVLLFWIMLYKDPGQITISSEEKLFFSQYDGGL